ncbi:MAG: hypothetical protein WC082_00530 [Victivallales bacterium]
MIDTAAYTKYWEEAGKYLRIAKSGLNRPKVFTPEMLYKLLGLSIEKFFIAAMVRHGDFANSRTFPGLADSASRIRPVEASLMERLEEAESYRKIRPVFDNCMRRDIPPEALLKMINTTEKVKGWADSTINS